MNLRSWRAAILVVAGALLLSTPSRALNRVALVIGNSNYANEPHLVNPSRDARAVADRGNAIAQANLGLLYLQGRGVDRDPAKARILMTKAAAQGNNVALNWLKLNPS